MIPHRVLLIHPAVRRWAKACNVPLGVAMTSAVLKAAGVETFVADDNMNRWDSERAAACLSAAKYDVIGISGICHQLREIKPWVQLIRVFCGPDQPVVVGGPISILGEKLVKWLGVHVWQGESEAGFPAAVLAGAFAGPARVHEAPGVVDDLDTLPFPDWDAFDMEAYAKAPVGAINKRKWADGEAQGEVPRSMNLLAARGCPFSCSFCAHDFMGKKYRVRSPGNILREMVELKDRYGISYWHLSDDASMARTSWLYKFCDAFRRNILLKNDTWGCAGRADSASAEVLKRMYDSGCRIVGMGIESGSQRILDAMNKRTTVSENEKAIANCKRVFGSANYSLIVGTPGETDRDIEDTIAMCRRTETRPETVFVATPLPGAPWYDYALEKKLIEDEEGYLLALDENARVINCNISGQSDEWVIGAQKRIIDATRDFGGTI